MKETYYDSFSPVEPTDVAAKGRRILNRRGGDPPPLGVSAAAMEEGDSW